MVLRYGDVIMMSARNSNGQFMPDVLVYARYSLMETIIIATNLQDNNIKFNMDLSQLLPVFSKAYGNNTVIMVKNLISQEEPEYYFLREFVELR